MQRGQLALESLLMMSAFVLCFSLLVSYGIMRKDMTLATLYESDLERFSADLDAKSVSVLARGQGNLDTLSRMLPMRAMAIRVVDSGTNRYLLLAERRPLGWITSTRMMRLGAKVELFNAIGDEPVAIGGSSGPLEATELFFRVRNDGDGKVRVLVSDR